MMKYLKLVSFEGISGNFSFDSSGDRPAVYDIVNFKRNEDGSIGSGDSQVVGSWTASTGLNVDEKLIRWPDGSSQKPNLDLPVKYWSCHDRRSRTGLVHLKRSIIRR